MMQFLGCLESPRFWTSDPSIDVSYGFVCVRVCVCVCVFQSPKYPIPQSLFCLQWVHIMNHLRSHWLAQRRKVFMTVT